MNKTDITCTHEIAITFPNNKFCEITLNVLESEPDLKTDQSCVVYQKDQNILNVSIQAITPRALRQKVNYFYESCYLIVSILEQFLP
ncbi:Transcription factor Pcc1 family protein [Theileria parva strain Muguga]|uniref:Transcription factor Pcc1 family protein n=1 Tax=Theileria parva strain Muguga TaxID=333668 RepID=UPI001C618CC3|nr:Transcription factor Pcc1 family protein [Theileria parva strain Muguga]KAF5153510.1 Transcription factor Pcc1 family protein [Theileria parva strain Muguga]